MKIWIISRMRDGHFYMVEALSHYLQHDTQELNKSTLQVHTVRTCSTSI